MRRVVQTRSPQACPQEEGYSQEEEARRQEEGCSQEEEGRPQEEEACRQEGCPKEEGCSAKEEACSEEACCKEGQEISWKLVLPFDRGPRGLDVQARGSLKWLLLKPPNKSKKKNIFELCSICRGPEKLAGLENWRASGRQVRNDH